MHKISAANSIITLENSPEQRGLAWITSDRSEPPQMTPAQLRALSKAAEEMARELETDDC